MASWDEVEREAPVLAARVRAALDPAAGARRHKTIATLRADGSPRISGIECWFDGGELRFGSMPGSLKSADLRRDPRFALHGPTVDPPGESPADWAGEAKIAGRAVHEGPLPDGGPPGDLFRADVLEVVWTGLDGTGTKLTVESWHPGRGVRRLERD